MSSPTVSLSMCCRVLALQPQSLLRDTQSNGVERGNRSSYSILALFACLLSRSCAARLACSRLCSCCPTVAPAAAAYATTAVADREIHLLSPTTLLAFNRPPLGCSLSFRRDSQSLACAATASAAASSTCSTSSPLASGLVLRRCLPAARSSGGKSGRVSGRTCVSFPHPRPSAHQATG